MNAADRDSRIRMLSVARVQARHALYAMVSAISSEKDKRRARRLAVARNHLAAALRELASIS